MMKTIYAVHDFTAGDWDNGLMPFCPHDYSRLKFGSDITAKSFGEELANGFYAQYGSSLWGNQCVVIPSPYNHVHNAATVMTGHFVNRLNHLLVEDNGEHVDYSIIHRKVSYTHDYGFMTAQQRRGLLANDLFYLNEGYYAGKVLIFIDDIRITGTHENRLEGILTDNPILNTNKVYYLYYAKLEGECRPDIEGALNLAGISTLRQYLELCHEPNHHVIVRPIKFLLSRSEIEFKEFLDNCSLDIAQKIYAGCLGEGYYKVPDYQPNFLMLKREINQ